MKIKVFSAVIMVWILPGCTSLNESPLPPEGKPLADVAPSTVGDMSVNNDLIYPQEKYFKNMRQLTFGGDNAEAYWSFDNTKMTFQSNNPQWGLNCDQIYYMDVNDFSYSQGVPQRISTGLGRTTCAYFMPGDTTILYASTHLYSNDCPPEPDKSEGYVWPVYPSYDIFVADLNGFVVDFLTEHVGYDAEATVSPNGDKIVFTSDRSGDLGERGSPQGCAS
jgi:TolB protein